ncbi:hypothetical protein [Myceligenerans xiligouense]|uniref:Uncharacterized protein n=1 Tax=Myceligenerans xiligouense TaxID=253184 RepID=A0A3N4YQ75_9MICO|nr:hypothetical protein [Myceligenerans xiligouense]RPF22247.1 hypothetical protein EDD34_2897 [Myceligenerans xiligouense]
MDDGDVVAQLPETHPGRFFSRIKPYGSMILHSEELADFADDLARVHAGAQPQEKKPLAALIDLARQYAGEPGIELHLDGD